MYCGGGHLGFPIGIKNIKFVEDLPMIIPGQFGFNCPSGFREEAFCRKVSNEKFTSFRLLCNLFVGRHSLSNLFVGRHSLYDFACVICLSVVTRCTISLVV